MSDKLRSGEFRTEATVHVPSELAKQCTTCPAGGATNRISDAHHVVKCEVAQAIANLDLADLSRLDVLLQGAFDGDGTACGPMEQMTTLDGIVQ